MRSGRIFSGARNVISDMTGCAPSFTEPLNRYSAGPIAAGLANNGGPTQTMAILASSDAVGFAGQCPKRDQRAKLRPANCDSGAYEHKPKRKKRRRRR